MPARVTLNVSDSSTVWRDYNASINQRVARLLEGLGHVNVLETKGSLRLAAIYVQLLVPFLNYILSYWREPAG